MSFGGHVGDMIRRDKDNRELRRSLTQGLREALSKPMLGKKINYKKVSLSKLEAIEKQIEEKTQQDNAQTTKNMIRIIAFGLILTVLVIILLKYLVENNAFVASCWKNFMLFIK